VAPALGTPQDPPPTQPRSVTATPPQAPRVTKGVSSGGHSPRPQAVLFFPVAAMHPHPSSSSFSVLLPCLSTHHASVCPGHLVPALADRTIMSPFCESAKMAALPLKKFPCSKTAPPLPETTALTSLTSPFYKSYCSPRLGAASSLPSQPGSLGLPLNFALWMRDFSREFSL
jgi:hypothetical protein